MFLPLRSAVAASRRARALAMSFLIVATGTFVPAVPAMAVSVTRYVALSGTADADGGSSCGSPNYVVADWAGGAREAIQTALGAASPDDTIWLCGGPYEMTSGTVGVSTAVTIRGDSSTATTIVNGGAGRLFVVTQPIRLTISHLQLVGGAAPASPTDGYNEYGGAIRADSDSTVRIVDARLIGNTAPSGAGGAIASWGVVDLVRSEISGNTSDQGGGAIFAGTAKVTVLDSQFHDNSAGTSGGAIYAADLTTETSSFQRNLAGDSGGAIYAGATLDVRGTTFGENSAGTDGGAVSSGLSASMTASTFTHNVADEKGGAVYAAGVLTIGSSHLDNNRAGEDGGAVFSSAGSTAIAGGTFDENQTSGAGGALYAGNVTIAGGTIFSANTAGSSGGAIRGSIVEVSGGQFLRNQAAGAGGGIDSAAAQINGGSFADNTSGGNGGAIHASGTVDATDGTFTGNDALGSGSQGGAIWGDVVRIDGGQFIDNSVGTALSTAAIGGAVFGASSVVSDHADYYSNRQICLCGGEIGGGAIGALGPVTVVGGDFSSNTAQKWGGAIFSWDIGRGAGIYVTGGTRFSQNRATGDGGAIMTQGPVEIDGLSVDGEVVTFAGNRGFGAGAIAAQGTVSVSDATFTGNESYSDAGAIRANGGRIERVTFDSNSASGVGGAISTSAEIEVIGSTFSSNHTYQAGGAINASPSALVRVVNSTFEDNHASWRGGGIAAKFAEITSATFVDNTSTYGGAQLSITDGSGGGSLAIANSLVSGGGCVINEASESGVNLTTAASCPGELTSGTSLKLQPLADNAGPTRTVALSPGSAAIDRIAVMDCTVVVDQRGAPRPQGATCDVGAFERHGGPIELAVSSGDDDGRVTRGTGVTLTMELAPATTGDIVVTWGADTASCTIPEAASTCVIVVNGLPAGPALLRARFVGNDDYDPAIASLALVVDPAPVTLTVSTGDTAIYRQAVPLSVRLSGTDGTISGLVTFSDGTAPVEGCLDLPVSGALPVTVSCTATTVLPAGPYTITAMFMSDTADYDATSGTGSLSITPAATTTTLTSSAASATLGQSLTLTATIEGTTGTISGSVSFSDGTTPIAGCQSVTLSDGSADCTTGSLAAGAHVIVAWYSGDGNFGASSDGTSVTVTTPAPSNPSTGSTAQTITFGLPFYAFGGTAAKPITLRGTASSKLAVTYSSSTPTTCRLSGNVLTPLANGTCTVTAEQGGDATYAAATSVTRSMTVISSAVRVTISQSFTVNGEVRLSVPLIVKRGTTVTMVARTTEPAMAGKTLEVWAKYGTGRWQKVAARTILSSLATSYRFKARPDAQYRWRWAGNGILHDQWSGSRRVLGL